MILKSLALLSKDMWQSEFPIIYKVDHLHCLAATCQLLSTVSTDSGYGSSSGPSSNITLPTVQSSCITAISTDQVALEKEGNDGSQLLLDPSAASL